MKHAPRWTVLCAGFLLAGAAQAQVQASLEFVSQFGQFGFYTRTFPPNLSPPTGFNQPRGIDFLTGERVLVADYRNNKLQNCDLAGEDCRWVGGDGLGSRNQPGTYDRPHGVEVSVEGKFVVADEDNHAVQLCTTTGACQYSGDRLTSDNKPSGALGRWAFPNDVAFDSASRIYGLDTQNNRIQILRGDNLNVVGTFLRPGANPGEVNEPRGLAIDAEDRVIIADTGNHRIQICDTDANCETFGAQGSAPGRFNNPVGVEVDGLGRIWVADTGNNRVQACDYGGNCVAFGANGGYDFLEPHDVAVHPSGLLAVADTGNNRIQIFTTESSFTVNAGFNDAWFDPTTSGQGFFVTVFPGLGQVFLAHFTYDTTLPDSGAGATVGDSGHRWLTAIGPLLGTSASLEVTLTAGGLFDAETPAPQRETPYGIYTLEFLGCDRIRLLYTLPSIPRTGQIELERVAKDNVPLCEALSAGSGTAAVR